MSSYFSTSGDLHVAVRFTPETVVMTPDGLDLVLTDVGEVVIGHTACSRGITKSDRYAAYLPPEHFGAATGDTARYACVE